MENGAAVSSAPWVILDSVQGDVVGRWEPEEATPPQAARHGVVLIEIWPDGLVRNPKMKKGLGLDQDEKDLKALEQRKFKTGMKKGSQPRSGSRPRSVSV
jgi:hypothetical protein